MSTKRKNVTIAFHKTICVKVGKHSYMTEKAMFCESIELCDTGENINVIDERGVVTSLPKKHIASITGDGEMIWDNRNQRIKEQNAV